VRLRGGFSFNGGVVFANGASGPAVSVAARLGVQFNHLFGLYYQATPMVTLVSGKDGVAAGFVEYNSLIANFTLAHMVDLGVGPSVDYMAVAGCGDECTAGSRLAFGAHGRVAVNIGGLSGHGPRRSGFAIGVDVHPIFLPDGPIVSLTGGIGGEWY
jgi:hypothetical protein